MTETIGGTMKVSSLSFRLTGTLLTLMLSIFFIGRVLQLFEHASNTALGALGIGAALGVIVGTIAVIWRR